MRYNYLQFLFSPHIYYEVYIHCSVHVKLNVLHVPTYPVDCLILLRDVSLQLFTTRFDRYDSDQNYALRARPLFSGSAL